MTTPVVLVVDDVHVLGNRECQAALSVLADHVPMGSRLALAGRTQPPLRTGRLRAEGKILEIGPADLTFSREEASAVLRAAELALADDEVAELYRQTEGWPAGMYLAALAIREGGSHGSAAAIGGDHVLVSEYMESEFLARIPPRHRIFLTRTAVLERMCGPLCEAVLDLPGSAGSLDELARSNRPLVPLDHRGEWYRYHHLFRGMLLEQLERQSPGLIRVLRRRAAGRCLHNDLPKEAPEYSIAAGDTDAAARRVQELWLRPTGNVDHLQPAGRRRGDAGTPEDPGGARAPGSLFVIVLMLGVGYLVGFRLHTNVAALAAAAGVLLLFGFALSWVTALLGLVAKSAEAAAAAALPSLA
jgi:LuxR family maltose regulon positive regulatory protein